MREIGKLTRIIRAGLLTLTLCALPALSATAPAAESRLDSAAIRSLVLGRAVTIHTPTRTMTNLRLEPGGAIRTGAADASLGGQWSIQDDELCLDIAATTDDGCMSVIRRGGEDDRLYLFTRAGEPFGEIVLGGKR